MKTGKIKVKKNSIIVQVTGRERYSCADFSREDLEHLHNQECTFELDENNRSKASSITIEGKTILPNKEIKQSKEQVSERKAKQREIQEKRRQEEKKQGRNNNRGHQNYNTRINDSYSLNHAKIPSDVKGILEHEDISTANFSLKLFKFARFDYKDNKGSEKKFLFFNSSELKDRNRNTLVPKIHIKSNDYGGIFNFEENQITSNQIRIVNALYGNENQGFVTNSFKPDWRFVIGLGTDSVYETGITLHHIYGFPYIPASAIKGICNHYAQDNGYHQGESEFKDYYDTIFGGTDKKGKIIFLDAMPKTSPKLKVDIMNPHYPDWYGSGKPPTDTQSPRPIPFLTVEETHYQFVLASKEKNIQLLQIALGWLENALKEKGIGAKTAVGYGYMQ